VENKQEESSRAAVSTIATSEFSILDHLCKTFGIVLGVSNGFA